MELAAKEIAVVSTIYDELIAKQVWSRSLDQISDLVGALGSFLVVMDKIEPAFNTQALSSFFDAESFQMHADNVWPYEQHIAVPAVLSVPPQTLVYPHQCWPEAVYQQLHSVQWLKKEMDIHHRCCMRLNNNESWFENLIFSFSARQGPISPQAQAALARVAPHFAKAIEVQRPFLLLQHKFNMVLNALDKLNIGVLFFNTQAQVILKNQAAQAILSQEPSVGLNLQQKLQLSDANKNGYLKQSLQRAIATSCAEAANQGEVIALDTAQGKLLLEVCPFSDSRGDLADELPGALVFMLDLAQDYRPSLQHLIAAYRLSEAEAEVVLLMCDGLSNNEIAEQRGVSANTVKMQLKQIFQKTGCNNRVELVRLAIKVSPPLLN